MMATMGDGDSGPSFSNCALYRDGGEHFITSRLLEALARTMTGFAPWPTSGSSSGEVENTEFDGVTEPIPVRTLSGGDASDILPDRLLDGTFERLGDSANQIPFTKRTLRGEFASLQRIFATRIERYDASFDVLYEDEELVVYRLETEKDLEYIFDYCEIEDRLMRFAIAELLEAIATDRAGDLSEDVLVVRKPLAFRAGERHILDRLSFPEIHYRRD